MKLDFKMDTSSLQRLKHRLTGDLSQNLSKTLAGALYREAESIMADAKGQTPVKTGVLRDSGLVNEPVISSGNISVKFGFGGAASEYAVVQHEDLTLKHPHGNAKFLERPALEHMKEAPARIAAAVRAKVAG